MTESEARELLAFYAATTAGGISQAIRVVLDADEERQCNSSDKLHKYAAYVVDVAAIERGF